MKRIARRALTLAQDLIATYWFLPSCLAVIAFVLALVMPWIDTQVAFEASGRFGWVTQTQPDGARAVLTVVAGSIIGVTGTIFSITIVAVSFASSNFGPRLISNFMRDRGTQLTLGLFIATFVYCVLVLRRVHDGSGGSGPDGFDAFVPHLSVLVALALALSSVSVLIYFIHHVPETINIDRLTATIGQRLIERVSSTAPDDVAEPMRETPDDESDAPTDWPSRIAGRPRHAVTTPSAGFVQRIDLERLTELAKTHDLFIRVQYRPGDFALQAAILADVYPVGNGRDRHGAPEGSRGDKPGGARPGSITGSNTGGDKGGNTGSDTGEEARGTGAESVREIDESADEDLATALRDAFRLSRQRTPEQDWMFLADELVEVIARALSPGTNDPVSAMTCQNWLASALIAYLEGEADTHKRKGDPRVRMRAIDFDKLVATTFDAPRQYVASDRLTTLHALKLLAEVSRHTDREDRRRLLRRRLDELLEASDTQLASPVDRRDVAHRHKAAVRLIDDDDASRRRLDSADWLGGSG